MAIVLARRFPNPIIHMQCRDGARTGHADREVEQAGRIPSARQQHEHGSTGGEQAVLAHAREHRVLVHAASRSRATKISVDSLKPFNRTSAIRSNSRSLRVRSTTGLVTSTSAPAALAPTREAMFTSRP